MDHYYDVSSVDAPVMLPKNPGSLKFILSSVTVFTLWVASLKMFYSLLVQDLMEPRPIVELHTF